MGGVRRSAGLMCLTGGAPSRLLTTLGVYLLLFAQFVPAQGALAADEYGAPMGAKFADLARITPENVASLEPAWTFHTGDFGAAFKHKNHSFQASPVLWQRRLYVSTSGGLAFAVDATNGKELWRFDSALPKNLGYSESASRGVTLWHDPDVEGSSACVHRVFLPTLIGRVFALDALDGKPCTGFGDDGSVDLRATALPATAEFELEPGDYGITSPPVVYRHLVIFGSAIGDNRGVVLERGVVRALDARTGAEVWRFDPIPRRADDPARSTWALDSADRTGGANAWPPLSIDRERGLVFVPTGSPGPDYFGGERLGDNRYANSLVALDADTGAVVWAQQIVHHDLWDYDLPAQPALVDLDYAGERIAAVVIVTKTGMLFSFRRDDGRPVHPVEERPVPASDIDGEVAAATQPFSSLPVLVSHKAVHADDLFGPLWFDRRACEETLSGLRNQGIFTPPSLQGTLVNPGWAGGANWGGVAIDATRQIAVVNVNQLPGIVRLIPREDVDALRASGAFKGWELALQRGTPYAMARRMFLSPLELPCTAPPWGKLVAVDLRGGKILWDVPLGTIADIAPAPVPNFAWGVPNIGGPLLTASGLVFIGAAAEYTFRAMDVRTGAELWRADLPTSANATPISYEVDGRQYVVIAVGGHGGLPVDRGDALMAFALPR
jgi:quinoprotein glucose dehydrogenase